MLMVIRVILASVCKPNILPTVAMARSRAETDGVEKDRTYQEMGAALFPGPFTVPDPATFYGFHKPWRPERPGTCILVLPAKLSCTGWVSD